MATRRGARGAERGLRHAGLRQERSGHRAHARAGAAGGLSAWRTTPRWPTRSWSTPARSSRAPPRKASRPSSRWRACRTCAAGEALIVAGCMPARYGDDLEAELTEARAFVPCSREDDIARGGGRCLGLDEARPQRLADAMAVAADEPASRVGLRQDIRRMRPLLLVLHHPVHPRALSQLPARRRARRGGGAGGAQACARSCSSPRTPGRWGADFDEPSSLAALVGTLAEELPATWFRVMYVQPEGLTDELLEAVAAHDNVCDYFDIPLQHVDADILRAMNRTGSREEFLALARAHARAACRTPPCARRSSRASPARRTTSSRSCAISWRKACSTTWACSRTRARRARAPSSLPGQVDEDEKADRAQRLRDLADAVCTPRIAAAHRAATMDVLVEGVEEDGQLFGRAMCQAPEVDGVTYLDGGERGRDRRVTHRRHAALRDGRGVSRPWPQPR